MINKLSEYDTKNGYPGPISNQTFSSETLLDKDFSTLYFSELSFLDCHLEFVAFARAAKKIHFKNCKLKSVTFYKKDLENFTFENCKLMNCSFRGAEIECFYFSNCGLYDIRFIGAEIFDCKFYNSRLSEIYFNSSSVTDFIIKDSTLEDIFFPGMICTEFQYKNGLLIQKSTNISDYDTFLKLFVRSSQEDQEALNFTMIFFIIIIISFYSFLKLI